MPLAVWFLAFLTVPSSDLVAILIGALVILDAISIGGLEFCSLEFCLNLVFWSCHPIPVDPSGDCIRVLCWDELLVFGACLACFGCSVLSIFGFQISSLVLHQVH